MPNNKENKTGEKNTKDGLGLILGGIFILALVFVAYNYFSNPSDTVEPTSNGNKSIIERIKDAISPEDEGDLNGNAVSDSEIVGEQEYDMSLWVATDYEEGDITGASYQVNWGDTLWEISEAVYGDGAQWTKILEANASDIGFLPSGQQALIQPGQLLVLP